MYIDSNNKQRFIKELMSWFKKNKRSYPWRRTANPYHILIAESLLLQTSADRVKPVYKSVIKRYPDPTSLANADLLTLEEMIKPLGLKYRAGVMIGVAKKIIDDFYGNVPNNLKDLLSISGIGYYIAAAILCFGFNYTHSVVDTNVVRVLNRLFKIDNSRPDWIRIEMYRFAQQFVDDEDPKDYNWAILDFGALVCKAKFPNCGNCPFSGFCLYENKTN